MRRVSSRPRAASPACPWPAQPQLCLSSQAVFVICNKAIEVTFQEARRHLGLETQRQCSDAAIARTTPVLLALFSVVTLLAARLVRDGRLPLRTAAWYAKRTPTFSDALAVVRAHW
jgi:hypothetical protein